MLSLVLNDCKTKRPSGASDFKNNSFGILFGSLPGSLSIGIRPSGDELCTTGDTTAERLYDIRMSLVTISFHSDTSVKLLKGKKKKPQNQNHNQNISRHGLKIILYLKERTKITNTSATIFMKAINSVETEKSYG